MPKKRKIQPVARPFATTSVPKKVTPEEKKEVESKQVSDIVATQAPVQGPSADVPEPDERAESNALQAIVDRLQEKTEKEIGRTLRAIEYDRKFTKGLSSFDLDPLLRDRILKLMEEEDENPPIIAPDSSGDKTLLQAGVLYGSLMRLGFTHDRTLDCMGNVESLDIEAAFHWLCVHCSEQELDYGTDRNSRDLAMPSGDLPKTPQSFQSTSLDTTTQSIQMESPGQVSVNPAPKDQMESSPPASLQVPMSTSLVPAMAEDDGISRPLTPSSDSSDLDPSIEYARHRLSLFKITSSSTQPSDPHKATGIRKRMDEIRQHYMFNPKDSDLEFQNQKAAYLSAVLNDSLRDPNAVTISTSAPTPQKERKGKAVRGMTPAKAAPHPSSTNDLLDNSDSDESGGVFGTMLDEMPVSETIPGSNTVVRIRDMSLPKQWGGRAPKTVLDELVYKMDKHAVISYFSVGGASRAVRAGVCVRWGVRRLQEWRMEEDGCHDEFQAEQFISTVALHDLSFVTTPGFAASHPFNGASPYRGLPPVYRDLWNELEHRRKSECDKTNRTIWGALRGLVRSRIAAVGIPKVSKTLKPAAVTVDVDPNLQSRSLGEYSEQLASAFRARIMSQPYQEMLVHRNALPIAAYRDQIISTLEGAQVMVLSGETGCGKSTQVPSFILEDQLFRGKPCKIYCTEPRRISAISLAQRVSRELGDAPGTVGTNASLVGYSIRLESNTSKSTRLAFVTNGIALRMLEKGTNSGGKGVAFDEVTHIIVDEVHERSIESDFLLIVLRSLLQQRSDLKVILMSATVDTEKISNYFGGCPIVHVPGRTFPVDVQFLEDVVELTGWSIKKDSPYAKRTNDRFYRSGKNPGLEWNEDVPDPEEDEEQTDTSSSPPKLGKRYSADTIKTVDLFDERNIPFELLIRLLEYICLRDVSSPQSTAILIFMPGMNEIRRLHEMLSEHRAFGVEDDYRIYPLHSTISSENQNAVFDIPPPGVRKIVVATNIAETGITIPDITCVIDSGKHREMRYDEKRQISRLVETFIARSNAAQRRGRAGRVQAGFCFHLFTKFRHDTLLADHPLPEMMRLSLSDLALRIKTLNVDIGSSIEDVLSRALDPPSQVNIQRAVSALIEVKALTPLEDITPMGRLLSQMPTDVHLGKFLLLAALFGCLDPALTIAAALNSKSPFVTPFGFEAEADRAKSSFRVDNSDFLTIHGAFASWRRAYTSTSAARTFCRKNYLSHQNLQQIEELRQQFLAYLVDTMFVTVDKSFQRELFRNRPTRGKTKFVQVPEHLDRNSKQDTFVKAALAAGLYPKILVLDRATGLFRTLSNNQAVSFHPSSVNFQRKGKEFGVNYLCYFTLMHSKKLYAWETGPIDDLSLLLLCGDADFKLSSDSVFIDRKIRYTLPPKTNLALKVLREHMASNLATQMRGKSLTPSQQKWNEMALFVLGKFKIDADAEEMTIVTPSQIDVKY